MESSRTWMTNWQYIIMWIVFLLHITLFCMLCVFYEATVFLISHSMIFSTELLLPNWHTVRQHGLVGVLWLAGPSLTNLFIGALVTAARISQHSLNYLKTLMTPSLEFCPTVNTYCINFCHNAQKLVTMLEKDHKTSYFWLKQSILTIRTSWLWC